MNSSARPVQRVVLYEGRDSQPLDDAQRAELLRRLLDDGYSVANVRNGGRLSDQGQRELIVLGRFTGSMFGAAGDTTGTCTLHVRDITGLESDQIVNIVAELCHQTGQGTADGWKPWFPVIDYDRCTNCMQCLSFCLFDVYGVSSNGKITVQNQSNCKTDCPACSRVCPDVAILFPKYKAGPINGAEINDDDLRREAMKVDISALLGGDIYAMLRDRSEKAKSRFSKERDDERALRERQRCLKKLKDQVDGLDIPPEVMSSLPSVDEIQRKAEAARQRAQQAVAPTHAQQNPSSQQS